MRQDAEGAWVATEYFSMMLGHLASFAAAAAFSAPASSTATARKLATELVSYGLTVNSQPQLSAENLKGLCRKSAVRLNSLLAEIRDRDVDPIATHYTFSEISHRQEFRWDLRMPSDDAAWAAACDGMLNAALPVLAEIHPEQQETVRPLMSGVLISREGATTQRWHADCDAEHFERADADAHCRIYVRVPCETRSYTNICIALIPLISRPCLLPCLPVAALSLIHRRRIPLPPSRIASCRSSTLPPMRMARSSGQPPTTTPCTGCCRHPPARQSAPSSHPRARRAGSSWPTTVCSTA